VPARPAIKRARGPVWPTADVGSGSPGSHILGFAVRRVILAAARFGRIDRSKLGSIDFAPKRFQKTALAEEELDVLRF
jgi:hypothetical protein